jgi:hypothetical protein
MKKICFKHLLVFAAVVLASCQTATQQQQPMSAAECALAKWCVAEGQLRMSTDGHGYIGILLLADGSCINVSLPERESKKQLGKPPVHQAIAGAVFPFPFADDEMLGWKVNGRKVGFGTCGPNYVFVD